MPRVVAVTATYRRHSTLARLLASLQAEPLVAEIMVVDNAGDLAAGFAERTRNTKLVQPGRNLGCGGGVALGLHEALRHPGTTHVWIFDDDAWATAGALNALLAALASAPAEAAVPLISDASGRVAWFPGPLPQPAWNVIRTRPTPGEFRARCGDAPLSWTWAPWPSLLVTRRAIEAVGPPRGDFWFQGEDLEWTARITARFPGVLAPAAECRHFPPAGRAEGLRLKQLAMLQNNAFTAVWLPHGARLRRHLPGNAWRFLRTERFAPSALLALAAAHWRGAIRGRPAGTAGGDRLRRLWGQLD